MKNIFNSALVLTLVLANSVSAAEYISNYDMAVVDGKAYLLEDLNYDEGTSVLKQYSFPGLVAGNQVTLDSVYPSAYANVDGIVVTTYEYDLPTETTITTEDGSETKVYKDRRTYKSYDHDLQLIATKTVEQNYSYSYVNDDTANEGGGASIVENNKCSGKKGKHKGKNCAKVPKS